MSICGSSSLFAMALDYFASWEGIRVRKQGRQFIYLWNIISKQVKVFVHAFGSQIFFLFSCFLVCSLRHLQKYFVMFRQPTGDWTPNSHLQSDAGIVLAWKISRYTQFFWMYYVWAKNKVLFNLCRNEQKQLSWSIRFMLFSLVNGQ